MESARSQFIFGHKETVWKNYDTYVKLMSKFTRCRFLRVTAVQHQNFKDGYLKHESLWPKS